MHENRSNEVSGGASQADLLRGPCLLLTKEVDSGKVHEIEATSTRFLVAHRRLTCPVELDRVFP